MRSSSPRFRSVSLLPAYYLFRGRRNTICFVVVAMLGNRFEKNGYIDREDACFFYLRQIRPSPTSHDSVP